MPELGTCRYCLAEILWTITAKGNRQAVNPTPDAKGNTAVYTDGVGTVRSRGLTAERPTLEHLEWLARPHPATCSAKPARRTRRTTKGVRAPWQRRWQR